MVLDIVGKSSMNSAKSAHNYYMSCAERMGRLISFSMVISQGLITFAIPIHLFGKFGAALIFAFLLLILMTSSIFNILGASSIFYYDILTTYIRVR